MVYGQVESSMDDIVLMLVWILVVRMMVYELL